MFEVSLTAANGDVWVLTDSDVESAVTAPAGALRELVGRASYADVSVPGRSGVIPGRARFEPISQEVEFYLSNQGDTVAMEEVYASFRRAWPAVITVDTGHPLGSLMLPVENRGMPGTVVDPSKVDAVTVPVTVFNKDGLFRSMVQHGANSVTVTNAGVELVYPKIVYSGAGGEVVTPSGARFTLPDDSSETVIDLDPRNLRLPGAFPEGVIPGDTGVWSLPAGATLQWQLWIADPWA